MVKMHYCMNLVCFDLHDMLSVPKNKAQKEVLHIIMLKYASLVHYGFYCTQGRVSSKYNTQLWLMPYMYTPLDPPLVQ